MTKVEMVEAILHETRRAKPFVRNNLRSLLQHKTKPKLERILKKVRVSRDGFDVRWD